MQSAILTNEAIWAQRCYSVVKRMANGIVVAQFEGESLAIHQSSVMSGSQTLHPIVGTFDANYDKGWIGKHGIFKGYSNWLRELRDVSLLEWLHRLRAHIQEIPRIKLAIEGWSPADLAILCQHGWFVGFSLHAPMSRLYALIPDSMYDEWIRHFDGRPQSLERFGAIYDADRHQLKCKLR